MYCNRLHNLICTDNQNNEMLSKNLQTKWIMFSLLSVQSYVLSNSGHLSIGNRFTNTLENEWI